MLRFVFRKRIAQEKSSTNLGPRPNELRPNPKTPKQMYERIKQSYISKRYLEQRSQGNRLKPQNATFAFDENAPTNFVELGSQLDEELYAGTFGSRGASSYQFIEALENFTQNLSGESGQPSTEASVNCRTSRESLQSLRRRLNERQAKRGERLRLYSDEELIKYLFVKRLSVGSLPSYQSTISSATASLLSKRTSHTSNFSTSTLRHSSSTIVPMKNDEVLDLSTFPSPPALHYIPDYLRKRQLSKPLRHLFDARRPKLTALKNSISQPVIQSTTNRAFSPSLDLNDSQPYHEPHRSPPPAAPLFKVEGFPHIGPQSHTQGELSQAETRKISDSATLSALQPLNQRSRPFCCTDRCRGDPRVDTCLYCEFDVPAAHAYVRSLVEKWRGGKDIVAAFASKPIDVDFGQVDGFGDTVLHLASSLGAGSIILSWFISMGVDVHAKNVAGQTFMHVLDPVSFARCDNIQLGQNQNGKENIELLLNTLNGMDFDFNHRDDFGQTPMHVLTQYWLHVFTMELAISPGIVASSSFSTKDFRGRSIKDQIKAQRSIDRNKDLAKQRRFDIDALLKTMNPSVDVSNPQNETLLSSLGFSQENLGMSHPHAQLRKTIIEACSGLPETRYQGRNGLHCLAESCVSLRVDLSIPGPKLKRKRQAETTLRHDYITNTLKKLLEVGVDPNDYDNQGNTPIMSFIRNDLSPKPERKLTAEVLQLLINKGASVHRRNRKGETGLHIAMRLGRPSAVEVLLNNYANVHARARHGEGVLAIAGKASLKAKQNGALYHRIITCMAVAGKYGAILGPSTKDEWDRQRKCVNKEGPVMIEGPREEHDEVMNVQ